MAHSNEIARTDRGLEQECLKEVEGSGLQASGVTEDGNAGSKDTPTDCGSPQPPTDAGESV